MSWRRVLARFEPAVARAAMRLPDALVARVAPPPSPPPPGQRLDPKVQLAIAAYRWTRPVPLEALSPPEARRRLQNESGLLDLPRRELAEVRDLGCPGPAGEIPLRLYRPEGLAAPSGCLLWLHGGGFVLGGLDDADRFCRHLAAEAGVLVVSVDYRLAPEHPFPAAADDACAAWRWLGEHAAGLGADPARLGVGGDSAGGKLSAVVAQAARALPGPAPRLQLLVYPSVAVRRERYASVRDFGAGYLLTASMMRWFYEHYLPDPATWDDPRAAPILGDLSGLAPAYIAVAGFDPLRDEGRTYAEALRAAGNEVTLREHAALTHSFLGMAGAIPACRAAVDEIVAAVRAALAPDPLSP